MITAFLSYAHHDADANPGFIDTLKREIETRVNSGLVNVDFSIWRDTEGLRTGVKWDARIGEAIQSSKIFILLLSPKWISSDYCRKEFDIFENIERSFPQPAEYIAPIVLKEIDSQIEYFTDAQNVCFSSLAERQYTIILSSFTKKSLLKSIDKVSDDILAMIERHRRYQGKSYSSEQKISSKKVATKFDNRAHNFEKVEIVSSAEIVLDDSTENYRKLLANVSFIRKLYVQAAGARVEFGIQRAILSLESKSLDPLEKNSDWLDPRSNRGAYYISNWGSQNTLTICMDALPGHEALQELPLPPAQGENFLSHIGSASSATQVGDLTATLTVSLCQEGLYIYPDATRKRPNLSVQKKIAAIIGVAVSKYLIGDEKEFRKIIEIKERAKNV